MTAADRTTGPPEPPGPHPDLDTLADLDADLLPDAEAGPVRAHAASCARCGQVLAALGGVRADLRALPAPPLPAAVAARLDATLADLRRAPAMDRPAPAPGRPPARVSDLAAARERRGRRLRALGGAAAAAVALVVAGASVTSLVRAGGGSDDAAGGGGGTALEESTRQQDSGAAAPGAAQGGPTPNGLPALPDFDRASLTAALPSLTTDFAVSRVAETTATGPAGALADPALRTACAEAIPGAGGDVVAVRWIRYAGRPAYVLVLADGGGRTAYVVGDQCGRVPSVPATVLDTLR